MIKEREIIRIGQLELQFLMEGEDSNGQMAMFETVVPEGARVPLPHYHEAYDETVYGLEGTITFVVNGKIIEVGPGKCLFIPRGAVHGFNNMGKVSSKMLAIITPALIGAEFFRECSALVNAGGPPDMVKMKAILLKYGLVPVIV